MNQPRSKKIATNLTIIWLVMYSLFAAAARIYLSYCQLRNDPSPHEPFSLYHILVGAGFLGFFYPSLFVIHRHSKIAEMKPVTILAKILIICLTLWGLAVGMHAFFE